MPPRIIEDPVTEGQFKKGGDLPDLPVPGEGEVIRPCHLDRLPDYVKVNIQKWKQIENKSNRIICNLLAEMGYEVQHVRLWRWCNQRFRGQGDIAAPLLQEANRLEIERKAVYSVIAVCMESLRRVKPIDITTAKDLESIAGSIAKLQTSMANRDRINHEIDGGLVKAVEMLQREIQNDIKGRPELVNTLLEIAEKAKDKLDVTGGK